MVFGTGEVNFPKGALSPSVQFTATVPPDVPPVRRLRYETTRVCDGNGTPLGFGAVRLFGSPVVPVPRLEMFRRYQALAGQTGVAGSGSEIHSTPLVANLTDDNGDGRIDRADVPDIVTIREGPASQFTGTIKIASGDDGRELFTVGTDLVSPWSEAAVGDLDGDGSPEIVAVHSDGNHLIAFGRPTGSDVSAEMNTLKWLSDAHAQPRFFIGCGIDRTCPLMAAAVSIANLDGAGNPEVVAGAAVYDATGKLLGDGENLGGTTGGAKASGNGGPKRSAISAVSDVDLDGVPELVAGPSAYQLRGGSLVKVWQRTDRADGIVGIGNFDSDPQAEIVIVANGQIYMLDHDGSDAEVWNPTAAHAPITLPTGGSGGAPTIADFDGDGVPEIGVAGRYGYAVLERDGSVRWQSAIMDFSSNSTGSTVFDFDRDGSVEVLYRDELYLRVYRGSDGVLLARTEIHSATWTEEPVVADVDGDGDAEIAVVSDQTGSFQEALTGVHVFEDVGGGWAPTRRIWNQHSYHITNVNEDGTIPVDESENWLVPGLNDFRLNAFGPGDTPGIDDSFTYVANDGALDSQPATVRITIDANRPPVITSAPLTDAFHGVRYSYAVTATDPDGDTLAFSLPVAPAGMTIDPASGVIGWTPTAEQAGEHAVTVRVADGSDNVALQKYTVTVGEPGPDDLDNDGDGLSKNRGDCNDVDPTIRPGAPEVPNDGIDQDCNGADLVVDPQD
ncbi:MAG: FG-GAP-like repeat-containing protein, partial [Candidatus Binatia bacterium]